MNSGIYKYLDQQKQKDFYQVALLPGLVYLTKSKNFYRGILFLVAGFACFLSVFFALFETKFKLFQKALTFLVSQISSSLVNNFEVDFYFLFFLSLLSLGFYLYLVIRTNKDLKENFREKEKDQKSLLFGSSISSAYLLFICAFFTLLIYVGSKGLFVKKEKFEEIKIENLREFIENPDFIKAKKPKKDPKRLAKKDAIDSGQHNPNKQIRTGQKFSSRKAVKKSKPRPKPKPKSQSKQRKVTQKPKKQVNPYKKQKEEQKSQQEITTKKPKVKQQSPPVKKPQQTTSSTSSNQSRSQSSSTGLYSRSKPTPNAHPLGNSSQSSIGGRKGNAAANKYPDAPVSLAALAGADYSAYRKDLERRIYAIWTKKNKNGVGKFSAKIGFVIYKNGSLKKNSVTVISSNGNSKDVSVAKSSVVEASPYFRPLPKNSPNQVRVEFDFSYAERY